MIKLTRGKALKWGEREYRLKYDQNCEENKIIWKEREDEMH